MDYKMIMTSGYPELTCMIQKIASELGFSVRIVEGILFEAAQEVLELISEGDYEVIISRAGTAKILSDMTDLPVVYSDSSDFDILHAFIRAKKLGDSICFLTYQEEGFPFNFDKIEDIIGFGVKILPYRTWDELVKQIKSAKELGMDVVVGGGIRASEIIKNYGMHCMHITASERTIKRSLIRAHQIAQNRISIKEKVEQLNAVINVSEEGIIFLNKDREIKACNPAAERIFGIEEKSVLNRRKEISSPILLEILNRDEVSVGNGSFTVENIIVTYEPVLVGKERVGTVITCQEFSKIQQLEDQVRRELYSRGLFARYSLEDIYHSSNKMKQVIETAREYARTDSTVLIMGESGTGKELIAQGIHNASNRKEGPFVAVNCAAFPESLLESELFGYAEGAFTGAKKGGRQGVFELAHGGTIFLDEIGEITPNIQARLLRVLQEKEVMRVGGDRVIPIDIRVVVATNRQLWEMVKEGKFRSDLYFRLSVLLLEVPSLCQRREDIPGLVEHLFKRLKSPMMWNDLPKLFRDFLLSYEWPGNVRQLENTIERYHLRVKKPDQVYPFVQGVLRETNGDSKDISAPHEGLLIKDGTMEEMEKQIIRHMLERYNHNKTLVAEKLGISRATLWKKAND
ncbi:sigma 54-interacting transcriptional regulator [Ammoniphilus sp. 3BR4]